MKFLKKYSFKFLFVAFLGIHIPLIGLILFLIFGGSEAFTPTTILISVLIFTLFATGVTLLILNKLLEPILLAKNSLSAYIAENQLPDMPTNYNDEVGVLLKEIQFTIRTLDDLIKEKQDLIGLMSHDLKNPLSAIMNYSEIIKMEEKYAEIGLKNF
jgi:signal transduction histidine kinase